MAHKKKREKLNKFTPTRSPLVERCQKMIQKSLETPRVKLMLQHMKEAGCPVGDNFIRAVICGNSFSGFYRSGKGEGMRYQDYVTQTVMHELIHAYDDCRAANANWTKCAHQACSEIRANHLSGDCHYVREHLRLVLGVSNFRGHEPECVRRRALTSLKGNRDCATASAKNCVEAVWDVCYNDTKPFDRAP